jgi:hypothetical protein
MDMPMVQFRRFREAAALIPPAAGGSYRLDLYAAEAADKAVDDAMRVKTWLKCLRLLHLEPKLLSIGVMQVGSIHSLRVNCSCEPPIASLPGWSRRAVPFHANHALLPGGFRAPVGSIAF